MKHNIEGGSLPVLTLTLENGEKVFSDKGDMCWMTNQIEMETTSRGGLLKGLARTFSGDSMFLNTFTAKSGNQSISFASHLPGSIVPLHIDNNKSYICQKGAFLAAEDSVNLEVTFTKRFSSGLLGGEGFILQKLSGSGQAFLEIDGHLVEKELASGEELLVEQGYVGYFEESVRYELTRIKGVKNILLGGEGLFLVKLVGPGKVGLQSMPVKSIAKAIIPYIPTQKSSN